MLGLVGTGKLYVQAFGCHSVILTGKMGKKGRLIHERHENCIKDYLILVRVNQHWPVNTRMPPLE